MATQGIVSIIKDGKTLFKCVAGCNGMTAKKTAKALSQLKNPTIDQVHKVCLDNNFGCKDCIITQSSNEHRGGESDWTPDGLYTEKFNEPRFNPRWNIGIASHVEIINL